MYGRSILFMIMPLQLYIVSLDCFTSNLGTIFREITAIPSSSEA